VNTGLDWTTVTTDKLAGMAPIVKKISRISASEIWQPYSQIKGMAAAQSALCLKHQHVACTVGPRHEISDQMYRSSRVSYTVLNRLYDQCLAISLVDA